MSVFLVKNDVLVFNKSLKNNNKIFISITKVFIMCLATVSMLAGCEKQVIQSIKNVGESEQSIVATTLNSTESARQVTESVRGAQIINNRNMNLPIGCRNQDITKAYAAKKNNVQVKGCGQVEAMLPTYDAEYRHQRFTVNLIDVSPSQRVVVDHDTQFGEPIKNLQKNDTVVFYGVYVYTLEGGKIQWTQKEVPSRYQPGWVEKNGVRYD